MDPDLEASMRTYYDERAAEYDELYAGKVASTPEDVAKYTTDSRALLELAATHAGPAVLDAPSGTAFWLAGYGPHAEAVTLVDQSPRMLAEARARVRASGIGARCRFVHADLLHDPWDHAGFDTVLSGFFLSHLDAPAERTFVDRVRRALRPGGSLLVFDSAWNAWRARTRPQVGRLRRTLNDGRPFDIYKRYFERRDVEALARTHGADAELLYEGEVFLAFALRFG